MKKIYVFLVVAFFFVNLFAEKDVFVSDEVQSFLNDIFENGAEYHRSGYSEEKDRSSIPEQGKSNWYSMSFKSYRLIESEGVVDSIAKEMLQSELINSKEYVVKKSDTLSSLLIELKKDPKPSDITLEEKRSNENYIEMAKYYIPDLKELNDAVEFESISIETAQCLSDCKDSFYEEERVSGIYVRFRRLFKGGMVKGGSKISIKLDPNGSLRHMKIVWPEIIQEDDIVIPTTFEASVDSVFETLSKSENHVEKDNATFEIESFEIEGMAKAWVPSQDDRDVIIPAFSYKIKAVLSDGSVAGRIFNVPLTK